MHRNRGLSRILAYAKDRSAFALITVLGTLALVLILLIGLLQNSIAEHRGAVTERNRAQTRMLEGAAVNILIGQLRIRH